MHLRKMIRCLLWGILFAAAAIFLGELLINKIYFRNYDYFFTSPLAIAGNIVILSCFFLILIALINRLRPAIVIGLTVYALLILSDILKLLHFDNPLLPTDLQYAGDLGVIAKSFINAKSVSITLAIIIAIIALFVLLWKKEVPALSPVSRIGTGCLAAALIVAAFVFPSFETTRDWLGEHGIELPEYWQFEPRASAQLNGLLVEWALSSASMSFHQPENYSRSEIERIARAFEKEPVARYDSKSERPPNLIIFIVESFMDPLDLGMRFTSDPIPTFRSISSKWSSGKIVVPVFGGTSANTEFELLTGLSMYFLPEGSCPYRQYLIQDIPSLPRTLHRYGYRTIAIPADPPYLFNRREALPHLGFDKWIFPETDPKTPRTPDDVFAADEAIVDAVIDASRAGGPFFIEAFTGGTHFPWDYPNYKKSSLDVIGPMAEPYRSRLKTYINALRVADNSLKKLIAYFEKSDQKTTILILGDHLPPLAEIYDQTGFFNCEGLDEVRKRYQVPAVLWSNFSSAKEDFVCSANFVPVRLLQFLGLRPTGSLALSAEVYSRFPVLSNYVQTADGRVFAPQSPDLPDRKLLDDYRMIQYDLLLGKQYALQAGGQ
jgi:hypothetical protein